MLLSLSSKNSMRVFIASNSFCKSISPFSQEIFSSLLESGNISINSNRLRNAVSSNAILLSSSIHRADNVGIIWHTKRLLAIGQLHFTGFFFTFRLLGSSKVISSPRILEIFPRLISSMIRIKGFCVLSSVVSILEFFIYTL